MHAQLTIYDNLCGEARNEATLSVHIEYHFPNHKCSVYNTSTLIIGVNTQVYLYNLHIRESQGARLQEEFRTE